MKHSHPIRHGVAAGLLLAGAVGLHAQMQPNGAAKPSAAESTLPAAQPTRAAAQPNTAAPAPESQQHVEVDYAGGMLAVRATNASLNQILREVGRKTGMKITGGVADERVFGSYGPSTPALVLDALLEGTDSNVLLVNDAKGGSELILTPRHGGATPPNPNAAKQASETSDADETSGGGYVPPVRPYQPPGTNGRVPGNGAPDAPGYAPGNGTDSAGGGNRTPQEIYEHLQQTMQQQQRNINAPSQ